MHGSQGRDETKGIKKTLVEGLMCNRHSPVPKSKGRRHPRAGRGAYCTFNASDGPFCPQPNYSLIDTRQKPRTPNARPRGSFIIQEVRTPPRLLSSNYPPQTPHGAKISTRMVDIQGVSLRSCRSHVTPSRRSIFPFTRQMDFLCHGDALW